MCEMLLTTVSNHGNANWNHSEVTPRSLGWFVLKMGVTARQPGYRISGILIHGWGAGGGWGTSPGALPLEEFGSFFPFLSYEDAHSDIQGRTGQQKEKPFWWKLQMSGNLAVSCKLNTLLLYNTVTPLPEIHPGGKTTYILESLRHRVHSGKKWGSPPLVTTWMISNPGHVCSERNEAQMRTGS